MVAFRFGWTAALAVLSALGPTRATPLADKLELLSPAARDVLKSSIPAPPHFVAYDKKLFDPVPSVSALQGFNVFVFGFLLSSGSIDEALKWEALTASQRASYLKEYNDAGISLVISAFGATETPTTSGEDPVKVANVMADWVIKHNVNGIDVNYEDFGAFQHGRGDAEAWLIAYTQQLRDRLPQEKYIVSHAPIAPWFSPKKWSGGGYLAIHEKVGCLIDWYNIKFYNQSSDYTTCSGLFDASSEVWPETAVFQIANSGVELDKLVIEKPGIPADAGSGYMAPSALALCVSEAASQGWKGGVAVWQYPDGNSSWITTVRGATWPVAGTHRPSRPIASAG